jgi:hypothetical protein
MDYSMRHISSPPSLVLYPPCRLRPSALQKKRSSYSCVKWDSLHSIQGERFAKVKACSGLSIMIQKQ